MFGWILYILAILIYAVDPVSIVWMVVFGFGMIFHFKWWLAGIVGFLIGCGWSNPFNK